MNRNAVHTTQAIRAVVLYRVSTKQQKKSGLGLETQQIAVNNYQHQYNVTIEKVFYETKSGKKIENRPVLKKALRYCRKHNTLLIIATLDRLARNVFFIASLMESKVRFVAADRLHAGPLELLEQAIEDHREGEKISRRTRDCLQAAKGRGVQLGTHGKILAQQNKRAADVFALKMKPVVQSIQREGITSVRGIAKALREKGCKTFHGKRRWHANTVHGLLRRISSMIDGNIHL